MKQVSMPLTGRGPRERRFPAFSNTPWFDIMRGEA
jgi:hypothetical protein